MFRSIKFLTIFLLIVLIFTSSCKLGEKKEDQRKVLVINKIQGCSRLASVEYVIKKIIMAKKTKRFLGLKLDKPASFMAETRASIKAGIDLSKLEQKNIKIEGSGISILLPAVEIVSFDYSSQNCRIIDKYTVNSIISRLTLKEKDELYRKGEMYIWDNLHSFGIIKAAETNLKTMLTRLLSSLNFTSIDIRIEENKELSKKIQDASKIVTSFEKEIETGS